MGRLCETRGQRDRAAAHYKTAAQAAWAASGERWLAAQTQHDLLVLHADDGDYNTAFHHARRAYLWMPKHHSSVPALAHDYCLVLLGFSACDLAFELLEATVEKDMPRVHKVVVWGTLARTAGLMGKLDRFREAEAEIENLVHSFGFHGASARVNLALGAYALGLFDEAERNALHCIEIAKAHLEAVPLRLAEELLVKMHSDERADPPPHTFDVPAHLRRLAQNFTARLAQWRGPTWKCKRQSSRARLGSV
jgi:hypothetical protein